MDYESMSDFEINKAVAECRGGFGGSTNNEYAPDEVICYDDKPFYTERDFCNKPSDAWSIIAENKIDIELPHEEVNQIGFASNHFEGVVHEIMPNDNPLRAACIVYLMMQEGKQCLASQ